jgi:hypothetical protein
MVATMALAVLVHTSNEIIVLYLMIATIILKTAVSIFQLSMM